jgi:hypothetical protein
VAIGVGSWAVGSWAEFVLPSFFPVYQLQPEVLPEKHFVHRMACLAPDMLVTETVSRLATHLCPGGYNLVTRPP